MFEIGSIGKSFTNFALMKLRNEGLLDRHAPMSCYLPWFEVQSGYGPVTTSHLITYAAGLRQQEMPALPAIAVPK